MPIRPATYKDISTISKIFASSFHDESLHVVFFPYRNEYPDDYLRAWRHRVTESWWDYQKRYTVSYEVVKGTEVLVGAAEWTRSGDGWEELWGIKGWWDPRLLIHPFTKIYHTLHRFVFRNRASVRPTPTEPNPLTYWNWQPQITRFIAKYFVPPTSTPTKTTTSPSPPTPTQTQPFYELGILGVLPSHAGHGTGRALCAHGLQAARDEAIPAVVIAAEQKEKFYQRCGFVNLVGSAIEGDDNPLARVGVKGGAILWTDWPHEVKDGGGRAMSTGCRDVGDDRGRSCGVGCLVEERTVVSC